MIEEDRPPDGHVVNTSVLVIGAVTRSSDNSRYSCTARERNSFKVSDVSDDVTPDVSFIDDVIIMIRNNSDQGYVIGGNLDVVQGDGFTLICDSACNPLCSYTWRGGEENVTRTGSTLSLVTVTSGITVYTCHASNSAGNTSAMVRVNVTAKLNTATTQILTTVTLGTTTEHEIKRPSTSTYPVTSSASNELGYQSTAGTTTSTATPSTTSNSLTNEHTRLSTTTGTSKTTTEIPSTTKGILSTTTELLNTTTDVLSTKTDIQNSTAGLVSKTTEILSTTADISTASADVSTRALASITSTRALASITSTAVNFTTDIISIMKRILECHG